jgi:hypothetical protein
MPITTPKQLDLAKRVSAHIHANPDQHRQGDWYQEDDCGTAACVAGWTAVLDGAELSKNFYPDGFVEASAVEGALAGGTRSIASYAREALGLTPDEAKELFFSRERRALSYLDGLIAAGEDAIAEASR